MSHNKFIPILNTNNISAIMIVDTIEAPVIKQYVIKNTNILQHPNFKKLIITNFLFKSSVEVNKFFNTVLYCPFNIVSLIKFRTANIPNKTEHQNDAITKG